jgi:hypothetical protein
MTRLRRLWRWYIDGAWWAPLLAVISIGAGGVALHVIVGFLAAVTFLSTRELAAAQRRLRDAKERIDSARESWETLRSMIPELNIGPAPAPEQGEPECPEVPSR